MSPWCVTPTPLGRPVDPDVYITYARFSPVTPLPSHFSSPPPSSLPSSLLLLPSSSTLSHSLSRLTTSPQCTGNFPLTLSCVNTTAACVSSIMYCNRSPGYPGSSGTYTPPARSTPNIPTTISTLRSTHNPTRTSAPSPTPSSYPPNSHARLFNSS